VTTLVVVVIIAAAPSVVATGMAVARMGARIWARTTSRGMRRRLQSTVQDTWPGRVAQGSRDSQPSPEIDLRGGVSNRKRV
jgi:hypothetical protein